MSEGIHIALKAEAVTHLFGIPITNTMLMSWVVVVVLIAIAVYVGRRVTKIPGRTQTFFEAVFGFILDYMEEVLENRRLALRFFPLIVTLFMFILLGNWFGLIPGINSVYLKHTPEYAQTQEVASVISEHTATQESVTHTEEHHVSLLYPMSTDLNVTLALAIVAFLVIEISGVAYLGLHYFSKFFNFKSPLGFFVGLIELISELARLISFSFRLFGNMFAGKTLILVAMFFVPYILPVPLMAYEVLVGFVQASIFALLTLFFVKLAMSSEAH